MDGQAGGFAGEVPQGDFDGADGGTPGFEGAAGAELDHDAFDQSGVFADHGFAQHGEVGLDVGLGVFDRAVATEAGIGEDADDRVFADDGAAYVGDLHTCNLPLG